MQEKEIPTLKMASVLDELKAFLLYLFSQAKLFLVMIIAGLIIGVGYYFWQKPKYIGKASFILEEKSGGMGSGLSGLASQFGIDIGSLAGSAGLFAGDNILDILKSRTIIEKVLLTKIDVSKSESGFTLADSYLEWSKQKQKWADNEQLSKLSFTNSISGKVNTRLQDSVLLVIYQKLSKKNLSVERVNKKGSIIEVSVSTQNEVFSKLFAERLVVETIKMYVDLKTSVASRNIVRLEQRSDSLMNLLNSKSYKSASLQILDANAAYKSVGVPVEVAQREKTVTYALYSEVMKNLEASRMALAGQTPVINLLDNAKYPLENMKMELWLLMFIGSGVGFGIAFLIAFYSYR